MEKKPDSPKDPQIKDDTKPNADKEWGKKDEEKLSKLKEDSKEFKILKLRIKKIQSKKLMKLLTKMI